MRDDERRREEGELHVKVSIKKQSQLISQPKGFGIVKAKSAKKKNPKFLLGLYYIHHKT